MADLGLVGRTIFDQTRQLLTGHWLNNPNFTTQPVNNERIGWLSQSIPGWHYYNGSTTLKVRDLLFQSASPAVYSVDNPTTYAYNGTVVESINPTIWQIHLFDLGKNLTSTVQIDTGITTAYSFNNIAHQHGYLMSAPQEGIAWTPSTVKMITVDYVFPTLPSTTPYFFKCTTAGTTGTTEPAWTTVQNTTVNDGTVVWTNMGRMIRPLGHGPVKGA